MMEEKNKTCHACGAENPEGNKFCEKCGRLLQDETEKTEKNMKNQSAIKNLSRQKKVLIGIVVGVLLIAGAVCGIVKYYDNKTIAEYNTKISEADKYLNEQDYEKAETAYLAAIDIEPKIDEAYLKVADVYVVQGKYEEAEMILQKGQKQAGGKQIKAKLKQVKPYGLYDEYINSTIVQDVGLADIDKRTNISQINTGLVSAEICDFNKDDIPDMLTVAYSNALITITLYTCKDDEVVELDSVDEEYNMAAAEASKIDIFLKEYSDKQYLVLGEEYLMSGASDTLSTVFEIDENIEKQCTIYGLEDILSYTYSINDKVIAEFDESVDVYEGNEASHDANQRNAINTLSKSFEPYGIKANRLLGKDDYGTWIKRATCKEEDTSETYLCYFQTGFYTSDRGIEFGGGDKLIIKDKTDVRSRIK